MAWIVGAVVWILAELLLVFAGEAVMSILEPLIRPFGRLYRPPRGRAVLVLTWFLALVGTGIGLSYGGNALGVLAFCLCIPGALVASAEYRRQRRKAEGSGVLPRVGQDQRGS